MVQNEIKILIIDDEEVWSDALAMDLQDFGYSVAGTAANFEEAVTLLNDTSIYDLALVDIKLGDRNAGIELGRLIHHLYRKPFIFMTASQDSHTLQDVKDCYPSAYLIKPINPSSLIISIQNALFNFVHQGLGKVNTHKEVQSEFFFVKHGNKYKKIEWGNVVYLRTDRNYTFIFNATDKTEYPIRSSLAKTLNYIIPQSLKHHFIQVNRAEVVKTSFITEINGNELNTMHKVFICTDAYLKDIKNELKLII